MRVTSNQSIQDINIQSMGTLESMFELAAANGGGITDDISAGDDYIVPTGLLQNTNNLQYLQINKIVIGTLNKASRKGIGSMRIGTDFIVG